MKVNIKIKLFICAAILLLPTGNVFGVEIGQCHTLAGIDNPQIEWAYPSGEVTWAQLEPTRGVYDFSAMDAAVNAAKTAGKKIWLQVLVADAPGGTGTVPQWAIDEGLAIDKGVPIQWDIRYLEYHRNIIEALAARYEKPEYYSTIEAVIMQGGGNYGEMALSAKYCAGDPNIPAGQVADVLDSNNIYVKEMARVFLGSASRSGEIATMSGGHYVFDDYYIQAIKSIIDVYGQSLNYYPFVAQIGFGLSCQARVAEEISAYGTNKYGDQFWLKFNGWGSFSGLDGGAEYGSFLQQYQSRTTTGYEVGHPAYWCAAEDGYIQGMCYDCCYWQTREEAITHNNNALVNAQSIGVSNACFQSVFFSNPAKYPLDMAAFAAGGSGATAAAIAVPIPVNFGPLEIIYPEIPGADAPQVFMEKIKAGLIDPSQALPLYVLYFYTLTIIVSGILAFGSVIYGVIRYLVSGGAVSQMIAAKEQIANAIIGLLIILSSYVIMATIDPQMLIISKSPTICAPIGDPNYDPLCGQPINYLGGYVVLMDYIEVPLGRLVESVIQKGWAAENAAYAVQSAAERLATLTKRLTTITNPPSGSPGCRCSDQDSSCFGATCSGSCRTEPCADVRSELDCLLYKVVTCPPVSSTDPVNNFARFPSTLTSLTEDSIFTQTLQAPASPSCSTLDNCLTADVINISVNGSGSGTGTVTYSPNICQTCGEVTGRVGDVQIGKLDGTFGKTIQIPPLPDCYTYSYDAWTPPVEIACPGTASVGYYYDARRDLNPACLGRHTVSCNVTVDKSCKVTKTTCGGTPVCTSSCGLIQDAINALKAARCQASRAQIDLAKELLKLKLAEALLRDSQAPPLTRKTFMAFEGENADLKKLSIWDNVKLDEDPYDDPEDPYRGEPEGDDPATFYVPKEGNEEIIEISNNAFFQFQPANGCEGLSGGGGQPPASCTASLINPFPAFYQYGPNPIVNPWQNSIIDSCSPTAIITNWGCGPTSLAMVVKYLTGQNVNPKIIADQLNTSDPSEWVCGVGTISGGINRIAGDYGLNHVDININQISGHIAKNHPVIAYCETIFGDPHAGHITVIKGDNCSQVLFQDTVDGERWEDKTTVQGGVAQGGYDCYAFSAFCKSSEGADCGVSVVPPGETPVGNFIAVNGTNCSENRSANKDLNPEKARGLYMTPNNTAAKQYIDRVPLYGWAGFDAGAPYLYGLLGRRPNIYEVFSLKKKNRSPLEATWPVHAMNVWEDNIDTTVRVPDATGYQISGGFEALVAYADESNITLNYLEEDQVAIGYAVQINNINVDPNIVKAYKDNEKCVSAGGSIKRYLLALKVGDPIGTTSNRSFFVVVRDSGAFMDPRLIQDWWEP